MEKLKVEKELKKTYPIPAEKRLLLFRRGIQYYPYTRKAKLMPICS